MIRFEDILKRITPFSPDWGREEILAKLAEVHGEFIVIHPFRDGNGRTGRLLSNVLLMQAETPLMRMDALEEQDVREEYFAAIRDVWQKVSYKKLIQLFDRLVPKS